MFCRIKNIECPHAGMIVVKEYKEFGEEKNGSPYTICYKEGGRIACTLEL